MVEKQRIVELNNLNKERRAKLETWWF